MRFETLDTVPDAAASNRPVDDWGRPLGDTEEVTAPLDRLLHHAHVLKVCSVQLAHEAARRLATRGERGVNLSVWRPDGEDTSASQLFPSSRIAHPQNPDACRQTTGSAGRRTEVLCVGLTRTDRRSTSNANRCGRVCPKFLRSPFCVFLRILRWKRDLSHRRLRRVTHKNPIRALSLLSPAKLSRTLVDRSAGRITLWTAR